VTDWGRGAKAKAKPYRKDKLYFLAICMENGFRNSTWMTFFWKIWARKLVYKIKQ
jgi:hypothetical protein